MPRVGVTSFRTSLLAWMLGCTFACAGDKPVVRWLVLDFPPFHIVSGPDRGTGLRDRYLDALRARLPDFDSRVEVSDTTRQTALMQAGLPVCSISMLKTPERERYMVFSDQPYGVQLPVRLIMTNTGAAALGPLAEDQGVDLMHVLGGGLIRLGVLPKRRFGPMIDNVVDEARRRYPSAVLEFNENDVLASLLDLVGKGRIEAALGYSVEVEQLRLRNAKLGEYTFLPLTQAPDVVPTYVACSRSTIGGRVIAQLNAQGFNDAATRQLRQDYLALLPLAERKRFERATAGR
ncbi:MAG: TIGR02285 family protein [Burkholderiales bacterium]|nr:TIGR02285 family protein [Burkholderiales bacterium]